MFRVGNTTVQKIHEIDLNSFTLTQLLPAMDGHLQTRHSNSFPNGTTEGERALLSVHS